MRIRDVRLQAEEEGFRADARIESSDGPRGELWFEARGAVPLPAPEMAAAAFAAACLPHAVFWEQDLSVEDPVDADFLFHLPILARAHARMHARRRTTQIQATAASSTPNPDRLVGMSFTGGVDSFYTLRRHRAPHALAPMRALVTGFGLDTEVEDAEGHAMLRERLGGVASELGLEHFTVRTNFREFFDPYSCPSLVTQGACLAAFAFLLSGRLHTYLVPSSQSIDRLYPYSSHALLDGAWIAGPTRTVSDGWDTHRNDKLMEIAGWPLALERMRVCQQGRGVENCGECEKCVRTLALLAIGGVRSLPAFPHVLEARHVQGLRVHNPKKLFWWRLIQKSAEADPELRWLADAVRQWILKTRIKMPFRQRRMARRARARWPQRRFV